MGKAFGCAVIALIVAVIMLGVGVYLIKLSGDNARDAALVSALTPADAGDVERAQPGERLIVLGQIDPDTPLTESSKGLAIYDRERYEVRRNSKGRTSRSWSSDGESHPSFRLLTEEGSVQIRGDDYDLELPRFTEPGRSTDGALRYNGFSPGDSVLVDGVVEGDGLAASAVVGGDQPAYVAMLKGRSSTNKLIGTILLGIGALPILVAIGFFIFSRSRSSSQSVAVAGDYTNLGGTDVAAGGYGAPPPPGGYGGVVPPPPASMGSAPGLQCPNCHNLLAAGEHFCGRCGSRVG